MEAVWNLGPCSVREIQESFPARSRPAFTTIQTTVYRLESNGAVRCVKRISNAKIFQAVISRDHARARMIDDLLALFGGGPKPVIAHLIDAGKLTLDDIKEAEQTLKARKKQS